MIVMDTFYIILVQNGLTGQGDAYENGSSGDTTSDDVFASMQCKSSELGRSSSNAHLDKDYCHGLWSNSSRLIFFLLQSIILFNSFVSNFSHLLGIKLLIEL